MTTIEVTKNRFGLKKSTKKYNRGHHYFDSLLGGRSTNIGVNPDYVTVSTSYFNNISATLNGEATSHTLYSLKPGSKLKIVTSKLYSLPIETLTVKVRE